MIERRVSNRKGACLMFILGFTFLETIQNVNFLTYALCDMGYKRRRLFQKGIRQRKDKKQTDMVLSVISESGLR